MFRNLFFIVYSFIGLFVLHSGCQGINSKLGIHPCFKDYKNIQQVDQLYRCDSFRKNFTKKYDLISDKRKDKIVISNTCKYCSKTLSSKYSLKVHTRIHTGEKPYKCTTCDRYFRTSSQLTVHQRTHNRKKSYKCDVCGKYFKDYSSFRIHQKKPIRILTKHHT